MALNDSTRGLPGVAKGKMKPTKLLNACVTPSQSQHTVFSIPRSQTEAPLSVRLSLDATDRATAPALRETTQPALAAIAAQTWHRDLRKAGD